MTTTKQDNKEIKTNEHVWVWVSLSLPLSLAYLLIRANASKNVSNDSLPSWSTFFYPLRQTREKVSMEYYERLNLAREQEAEVTGCYYFLNAREEDGENELKRRNVATLGLEELVKYQSSLVFKKKGKQ